MYVGGIGERSCTEYLVVVQGRGGGGGGGGGWGQPVMIILKNQREI